MEEEAALQEITNFITESQARVTQELAIATRIENAFEVEIEEFYDLSGDGNIGIKANQETGWNVGVGGSGRRIKSRVYRFKGWREGASAEVTENTSNNNSEVEEN
ncbi:hypothetical protein [Bacillus sp. AFS031507]|uniref:hypothetical protein n=1 Tax=Bacillus sp. AFS031507 TaxID=2033496 RepID=UPI000BFE1DA3|nr:hypothetical protein [Bacillus sp. AFS031507]PGY06421.1 hypothetical protein COE25_27755 [Bacillus sp. AFS031507]